jgi:hypothetical protein
MLPPCKGIQLNAIAKNNKINSTLRKSKPIHSLPQVNKTMGSCISIPGQSI